jgi:2-desacetyl-2-hydroxyethyl bacteriochlorophyllide A dehydrogenase
MKTGYRQSLFFTGPGEVEVRREPIPEVLPDQVLVQTILSAISPGTESLIYRGLFPQELPLDSNLPALASSFTYPLKYGYAAIGKVIGVGEQVDPDWAGRLVFAFHPHESHFTSRTEDLHLIPSHLSPEEAVFLPNMETAVNLVMDGRPILGENVIVFGQGIVGLLTSALLSQFPIGKLVTVDRYPMRRSALDAIGVHTSLDPAQSGFTELAMRSLAGAADLSFELSGAPEALDQAIAVTGFGGRIVIGSWYGQKRANLNLGGWFHRSRIQLISSQVSTIAPEFSARWDKQRRFQLAWDKLAQIRPSRWITHRFPINQAVEAYRLITHQPDACLQVILNYE